MLVKRNTKFFIVFLLIFAMAAGGIKPGNVSAAEKQATISVVKADGTPLLAETSVQLSDNETAYDALVNAVGADKVGFTQYSFGKMITSIDGESPTTGYWGFFVNNFPASAGADSYIPQDGDHIVYKIVDSSIPSNVSLQVIGDNNQSIYDSNPYNIEFTGNPTALQLLQQAIGADKVGLTDTQYGPMITSINGIQAQGNSYWAFYVNDQYASVGADSYQLKPSDHISFKYETSTPSTGDSTGSTGSTSTAPTSTGSEAFPQDKLQNAIDGASNYTKTNWTDDNTWGAIALKQAGKTIPSSYFDAVKTDIQNKSGNLHYITDTEKYVLGALAAGGDPTNIAGYNLYESIYNGDVTKQGLNGVAYALIALDASNYSIPASATWTSEKLINQLLSNQQSDGHWSLSSTDSSSDIDMTAMVLTALAPHKDRTDVKSKITAAVNYLASQYQAAKIDNSATAAQVVIALSALGIDANGTSFTKDNKSLVQYLMSFQNTDGGFGWKSGDQSDTFSTPQGFEGLVAYQLYLNGKGSLYYLPLQKIHESTVPSKQTKAPASTKEAYLLPNTAANTENMLLFGAVLVIAGMMLIYFNKKRKA